MAISNISARQRIDAMMDRTSWQPIPSGRMDTPHAIGFALLLGGFSIQLLYLLVNPLTALLTFFALIGYAVIYRLGRLAGAAPPLLGWCAITGEITTEAFLL
jgi:protoheme IX farnesyltransferase